MDEDGRGFDMTFAFLAEFPDSNYGPDGYNLPEPTSSYDSGHFYHGAVAATPDSTTSTLQQKSPSTASSSTKPKAPRRPRSQKAIAGDNKTSSKVKAPRKKSKAETVVVTETKTGSEISETVTTLKPLSKKDEIEFLREQVVELEKTLHELRRSSPEERGHDGQLLEAGASQEARKKPKRILSMWEEIAASQSKQRQSAQVENMKLKTKLEDQLKLAESLQRMLKRSKNDETLLDKTSKTPR